MSQGKDAPGEAGVDAVEKQVKTSQVQPSVGGDLILVMGWGVDYYRMRSRPVASQIPGHRHGLADPSTSCR